MVTGFQGQCAFAHHFPLAAVGEWMAVATDAEEGPRRPGGLTSRHPSATGAPRDGTGGDEPSRMRARVTARG